MSAEHKFSSMNEFFMGNSALANPENAQAHGQPLLNPQAFNPDLNSILGDEVMKETTNIR